MVGSKIKNDCLYTQGRREPTTGPGQNDDLWTRAPVPLEIADDKQYTNILPWFPGPSEHSGTRVFPPPPIPLSPALYTHDLEVPQNYNTGLCLRYS